MSLVLKRESQIPSFICSQILALAIFRFVCTFRLVTDARFLSRDFYSLSADQLFRVFYNSLLLVKLARRSDLEVEAAPVAQS
jgi:hypothetical protein